MFRKLLISTCVMGWLFGVSAPRAEAGLLPVSLMPVAQLDGNFRWTYQITLPSQTQIKNGDYFTIYDFAGFVPGSNGQPIANWNFSSANIGLTPGGLVATDHPALPNLTWQYTGMDSTIGQTGLGNFWATSAFSASTTSNFAARTHKHLIGDNRPASNITTTMVPVPKAGPEVPEPATLALAGMGLPLVGLFRMIRRKRSK